MYLTATDLIALFIALVSSVTLVITTAIANARLTRSRDEWRKDYCDLLKGYNNYKFATEAEAQGLSYFWDTATETWAYYPTKEVK